MFGDLFISFLKRSYIGSEKSPVGETFQGYNLGATTQELEMVISAGSRDCRDNRK